MYINDLGVKEVNAYYDRKGGIRTAKVNNYANAGSFANLIRQAVAQAQRNAAAQANATTQARSAQAGSAATGVSSTPYGTSKVAQGTIAAHTHSTNTKNAADSTASQGNGNVCCEQCHQTNQLILQMMTKNLYTKSVMGYPLTGMNAWTAYQSVAGMLGNSLFT